MNYVCAQVYGGIDLFVRQISVFVCKQVSIRIYFYV
jgi:hypothetical protein